MLFRSAVYGQEANADTWKMAKINMAIRGIDADFGPYQADTFTNDLHPTLKADFILANAREVFGLTARNRINKGFPGHTPLFLCPEIRAVRHRMAA